MLWAMDVGEWRVWLETTHWVDLLSDGGYFDSRRMREHWGRNPENPGMMSFAKMTERHRK